MNHRVDALISDFIEFEEKEQMFSLRFREMPLWDIIRYSIFNSIAYQRQLMNSFHTPRTSRWVFRRFLEMLWIVPELIRYWVLIYVQKKSVDLLTVTLDRNVLINGYPRSKYMYPIIQAVHPDSRVLSLDESVMNVRVRSYYPCTVLYWRALKFWWWLKEKKQTRLTVSETEKVASIVQRVNSYFKVQLSLSDITRFLQYQYISYLMFNSLLSVCRPRMILITDDGNKRGLIWAAKQHHIPIADVQHGLLSPFNILTHYSDTRIHEPDTVITPNYMLGWGVFWKTCIFTPMQYLPLGFPYFDLLKTKAVSDQKIPKSDRHIMIVSALPSKKRLIELTIQLALLLPDFSIYYKLRSDEYHGWKSQYPSEFTSLPNVHVIDHDDPGLYDYLAGMTVQVGVNSTVLIEGAGFGLRTFILNEGWYQEMEPFIQSGMFELVNSADDIVAALCCSKSASYPMDTLFQPNAVQAIKSTLYSFIRRDT